MKLYHFLMIMLMFNIAVVLVNGTGAWNIGINAWDVTSPTAQLFVTAMFVTLITLILGSVIYSMVKSNRGAEGAVYALFSGGFWSTWFYTVMVFRSIITSLTTGMGEDVAIYADSFLLVLNVIVIFLFIFGLAQMVRGGMAGME